MNIVVLCHVYHIYSKITNTSDCCSDPLGVPQNVSLPEGVKGLSAFLPWSSCLQNCEMRKVDKEVKGHFCRPLQALVF